MITQHDQDVILALEHIKQHPCGYVRDLNKHVAPEIILELKIIGILKSGCTHNGPTYALTTFGRAYAATVSQKSR